MDYKEAGVDVEAGRAFVEKIRQNVESTFRPEVIGGLGGFGGYFQLPSGYQQPVLVSGTDGVGTKLKIAHSLNRHDTVGIDLVAMCVNDVLTSGAEPLFFLDYLATGKLEASQLAAVVSGIASACRDSGCTLLGGETAEMPGFYSAGEYDLAGFCVGIVEKSQLLDGGKVQIGDVAIGLASSGVHSNGFSLVRKIIDTQGLNWQDCPEILTGSSLGEVLLTPTRLYVKPVLELLRSGLDIHAMAHITGGGIPENLPRCLGKGHSVQIYPESWPVLPIFRWLAQMGSVNSEAMFNTFNMGIGFVIIVPSDLARSTINQLQSSGINAYQIGEVIAGKGEIVGLDYIN
ncbi:MULTISPECIES: phosphoribosylformylglycinamidine cyclo-ligase [unclassified Microcystis]|jgi:phosphoribosylformylglycinamidine cyclo-ligase|uniref:phosphoribosylformylglycinamidine cyclo-ligase n=1 Tax=unclassified Microcystis TaxID=2643300 RepID=UPI00119713A1|nr:MULTISPECIES: phosphoribosylformylglycinamidine cyclo-ligase [unclassified Microcystis]MCA2925480.1 phosphoribosylformylglycinamidine cyclo-ligase [Microcystis sp. M020S1]MCA2935946.1 phosphoribosylformylglycinamidine cyclo-ligase [Microcystis sp. M015S1]MCA2621327.1 phosphoribosylformylglycinamidine cyclo-ligase [Microcystis sp. M099S2]MCA2651690.1 phosphoribosylformylglycinamidine cyclo-ligase [Microcystis sp. M065S2]MCA2680091.1 phosphoribosylformylglycinamidine cyclo-ligase [Microcystis